MYIREYGNAHKRALLFFPGSCEPWQEFAGAAEELAQRLIGLRPEDIENVQDYFEGTTAEELLLLFQ